MKDQLVVAGGAWMRAVQYVEFGKPVEVREVPEPEPGPGEVRLRVTAAGLCHSDIAIMSAPPEHWGITPPMTLGHEGAGVVDAVGEGVTGVELGDAVLVYGPWGCGICRQCTRGRENLCANARERGIRPPGLGAPGALAEYQLIDSARHLVHLGELDPVTTVPLTDAGLTPYHAISLSAEKLIPGSTTVVIGAGGLGHLGIQLLRALSSTSVVALDVSEEKLAFAAEVGAHHTVLSTPAAAEQIRELTDGRGADVVLDFVGTPDTVKIAAASAGVDSDITVVGAGGGAVPVGFNLLPSECRVTASYWGTRAELIDLVDLARRGVVTVDVERFELDETPEAYARLHEGRIRGRAVVVPG